MIKRDKISTIFVALFVAMLMPAVAVAQDFRLDAAWQSDTRHGLCIDFRVNSATVDRSFHDNEAVLERIDSLFSAVRTDSLVEIASIEFCGSASPDGNSVINSRLSRARMHALEEVVRDHIDIPDSLITYNDHYIAWHHFVELVEEDVNFPHRDEVLEILNTEYPDAKDAGGVTIDGRLPELRKIDNGRVWKELNDRYFVHMRNAWFIMIIHRNLPPMPEPEIEPVEEVVSESAQRLETEAAVAKPEDPTEQTLTETMPIPLLNIKMNAVEAAALLLNFGGEVRITRRVSIDVMGHYSPYDYFTFARKARIFAIQPELRYWWGESLYKGHFVGVHVPVAGFNVQLNDKYRYQDPNHALWGIGLSYGYAMPIGKNSKWGVEFTVGVGYMDIKYDVYEGVKNGKYLRTETLNYVGPTRLGVNFSYRIDVGKRNKSVKTLEE